MLLRALVTGVLLAGLLSACAVVDPVDSRYDTVSRSLAKGRDEAIFLNLVRASHDYPLAFTTVSNVTPTMTNTSSFALPSFSIGPPNCLPGLSGITHSTACTYGTGVPGAATALGSSTAANATAVSTNFSVSTQETGSFYTGFLKPIDLITLDYFIRQDYPAELLFWLFADSFQIGPAGPHSIGYSYNPPVTYGCPQTPLQGKHLCFKEWIKIAVLSGLTVELQSFQKSSSGKSSSSDSKSGTSSKPETTIVPRFCFSPLLVRKAALEMGEQEAARVKALVGSLFNPANARPVCGTPWNAQAEAKKPQSDTFLLMPSPDLQFRIVPRSAYGVFEFLGNLMKVERENSQPLPSAYIPPNPFEDETDSPKLVTTTPDQKLITVLANTDERCFTHTWFYDGDYCVPESATNTKRIFSLLSQLIAIETTASDLAITPSVRIIQ
ncbi:MAG: hypothetical protein WB760_09490 [Xanthobacteraceae bacterium]